MTLAFAPSIQPVDLPTKQVMSLSTDSFQPLPDRQPAFGDILAQVRSGDSRQASSARESAEDLVAMTLVQPLLAQMRTDVFGGGAFASGTVQDRLSPFADAAIARDIVKGSRIPLVDAIERSMTRDGFRTEGGEA